MGIKNYIKKRPWLLKLLFPLRQLQIFLSYPYRLARYGAIDPREYFIFKKQQLVYLVNSKVAQTAIVNTCGNKNKEEYRGIRDKGLGEKKHHLSKEEQGYPLFTFVRNPFERLYSSYKSKYIADKKYGKLALDFDYYMLGLIKKDKGFTHFVKIVSRIPDWASDRHFKSQYSLIYRENRQSLSLVGKYENLHSEFEELRTMFNLEPLPHMNKSSEKENEWMDAYTPELVDLVSKRYEEDLATWYPNAKDELLAHLYQTP
jgi:hypothetical protein